MKCGATVGLTGTHFRVWAPLARHVEVVLEAGTRSPIPTRGFNLQVRTAHRWSWIRIRICGKTLGGVASSPPDRLSVSCMCLGVILDVVYNHVGDDGNYLPHFSPTYFTDKHDSGWGKTFNDACAPVRQFAIDNAVYWIEEFHLDGLRLDAAQSIHDPQNPLLLASLVSAARAAAGNRTILISGEDYLQRAELLLPPERGGAGFDHAMVGAKGREARP